MKIKWRSKEDQKRDIKFSFHRKIFVLSVTNQLSPFNLVKVHCKGDLFLSLMNCSKQKTEDNNATQINASHWPADLQWPFDPYIKEVLAKLIWTSPKKCLLSEQNIEHPLTKTDATSIHHNWRWYIIRRQNLHEKVPEAMVMRRSRITIAMCETIPATSQFKHRFFFLFIK